MKINSRLSLKHLALALLFSATATQFAAADTVYVQTQLDYLNGAWVEIPGHDMQVAPPKDQWTAFHQFKDGTCGYYTHPYRASAGTQVVAGERYVKAISSTDPVNHASSITTTTVDKNGTLVSRKTVKSSAPAKTFYTQNGVKMESDKVIVKTTITTTI